MNQLDAKLLVVLLISLAISAGAAWWLAGRYRKALLRHMTAAAPDPAAPPAHERSSSASAPTQHVPFNLQRNRRHNRRLAIVIISISALIGATTGAFELLVVHTTAGFGWQRWLLLSLTYAWPLVPALGLLWRWPIGRTVAGIVAYLLCLTPLILVGSNVEQTLTLVTGWLASTTVLPLLTLLGLTASARIRAIAPLLFPPVLVMSALSMLGVEWLALAIETPPATLVALVETLGAMPAARRGGALGSRHLAGTGNVAAHRTGIPSQAFLRFELPVRNILAGRADRHGAAQHAFRGRHVGLRDRPRMAVDSARILGRAPLAEAARAGSDNARAARL